MPAPPIHPFDHYFDLAELLRRGLDQHRREGNFEWVSRDPCVYCGRTLVEINRGRRLVAGDLSMTQEHILPQSQFRAWRLRQLGLPANWGSGMRGWQNLAPACANCNGRRSNHPWVRWLVDELDRLGPSSWHPFRPGYRRPDPRSARPLGHRLELDLIGD